MCVQSFRGFVMWIHNVSHLPPSQHWPTYWLYTCSVSCLSHLYCVLVASFAFISALVIEKEDQPNSCWIQGPAFDIRAQALSEMSQLLLSL